ncbi:class I SAM-dependent methyltransferase [Streptomyces sp. NPDC047829]|uniref:class I SAM-dependent methyltransferase n=1 Tax=Streptomyces sp. NPDC047829 TaxID=3154609 RepID=UPI0033C70DE8
MYTPWVLRAYDAAVYRINCPYVWRISPCTLLERYKRLLTADHLDLGVGTGYLLDHCHKPQDRQAITLVDLNPNTLAHTARRLARYDVTTHQGNALDPLPVPPASFGSASTNFMLHCVPGTWAEKGRVFDHLAACVRPGGWIFGTTLLSKGVPVSLPARAEMAVLNRFGIFNNQDDDLSGLERELAARFTKYRLTVEGCTALFEARVTETASEPRQ